MSDISTRDPRDLAEYANAGGQSNQPTPGGHALVRPTTGLAERIVGAQQVAVYRDEAKILQKLSALAAAAGDDWFYRFPVKNNRTGTTDYIEGPSIKLANNIARIYGNCSSEVRELDVGDAWVFYARFTDIETGFSMERAYRQRKSQTSMRTRDADRQLDIAYQIGQSKAIRNAIVNALDVFADHAFEAARDSLVEKIGKDLDGWRKRTVEGIAKIPVELNRVERVIGKAAKDWLAPQVAQVIAMMKSIADGMASAEETFPPIETAGESKQSEGDLAQGAADGERGGEGSTQASGSAGPAAAAAGKDAGEAAPTATALAVAYQNGKNAKAAGAKRTVPREYFEASRTREAVAWQAGYDGNPMPAWDDKDK